MKYEQALQAWGVRKLADNDNNSTNIDPIEPSTVEVTLDVGFSGGCETCEYEYVVARVRGNREGGMFLTTEFEIYSFGDLLKELIEVDGLLTL